MERFFRFLAKSNADTAYAVRHPYRFSIKPKLGTSLGTFHFAWRDEGGAERRYTLISRPIFKLGVNVSYRYLTVGLQQNITHLFDGARQSDLEYSLTASGRKFGGDVVYNLSSHYTLSDDASSFKIRNLGCFSSTRLQANGYFVFNHRRFSYPAAFTQSYRQKRSCGSVVIGASYNYEELELDVASMPQAVIDQLAASGYARRMTLRNLNVNAGYAYNWVISRRWMFHGTLLPTVSLLRKSRLVFDDHTERLNTDPFNLGFIFRFSALWDCHQRFGGFTALMTLNNPSRRPVDIADMYLKTRFFYGFRF
ncbi:MAG: DUF4421 family protein [Bacteroides sp.]|nr:DUF4421 family protein [Bacteroides sp.]